MKIFLTGASGYIGNRLAFELAAQGHTIHALVRNQASARILQHPNIIIFYGDLLNPQSIRQAVASCEQVYHVAGYSKLWARERNCFYDTNVRGTENILEQSLELGVKKLVYTSSCAVFGPSYLSPINENDPRTIGYGNDYDLSKCLAESKVKEYAHQGLFAIIVNPSRVYGAGLPTASNALSSMLLKCLHGHMIFTPACPQVIGNYAYIDDVVRGHILAMQKGISGEQYILGGENISYAELFCLIHQFIRNPRMIPLSPGILKAMGRIQSLINRLTGREPVFTSSIICRYLNNMAVSSSKAIHQLDYRITPFRDGIRNTILKLQNDTRHD